MKFPLRSFSLRTLLLASLLAGAGMMVWRVREPWAFNERPLFHTVRVESPNWQFTPFHPNFSYSGDFLIVYPGSLNVTKVNEAAILDLAHGSIIDTLPSDRSATWHPARDILLLGGREAHATVIQLPEKNALLTLGFTTDRHADFTPSGGYLLDVLARSDQREIKVYSTQTWQLVATYRWDEKIDYHSVSPDDRFLLIGRSTLDCAKPERPFECSVEVFDLASKKSLWTWHCPDNVWHVQPSFRKAGNGIEVSCECRVYADAAHPVKKALTCVQLTALAGRGGEIVEELPNVYLAYNFNAETGAFISNIDHGGPRFSISAFDWKHQLRDTPDGKWRYAIDATDKKINLLEVTSETPPSVRAPPAQWTIPALEANGRKIDDPICISGNKWRIAACIEHKALGIWTRRRTHFEWWGIYEQPESWLFAVIFASFIWSVLRDRKDARAVAIKVRSG